MATINTARWSIRKLYKRAGSPYWYGHVRDKRSSEDKVHWFSTEETNRRLADKRVLQHIAELEAREEQAKTLPGRTFAAAFEEWLGLKTCRDRTLEEYWRDYAGGSPEQRSDKAKGVYKPEFGDDLLADIDMARMERFLKGLRDKGRSVRTRRKHLTCLRSFFGWSVRRKYVRANPCDGLKVERGAKKTGLALSPEEAARLLEAARHDVVTSVKDGVRVAGEKWEQTFRPPAYLWLAILTSLHTGLRRGNVLALRWTDIDLGKRRIFVPAARMKADADHEVPIHPELHEALELLVQGKDRVPGKLVLGEDIGEIKKSFKTALRRAKLPATIRWHDLRHTFGTWVSLQAPFVVYRALMGHSPGSVSERYAHVPWDAKVKAIEALPRLATPEALAAATARHRRAIEAKAERARDLRTGHARGARLA